MKNMPSKLKIEELEKRNLDYIVTSLEQDRVGLLNGLNSRLKILNDWKNQFLNTSRSGYKASDLEVGAERIFHYFFTSIFKFPISCPIGSDLMYQNEFAIIHIEIKTAIIGNPSDYKGKVQLGWNQTSYGSRNFTPNLPPVYSSVGMPTLTYAIQIIHKPMDPKIYALSVISIPNGQLSSYYGDKILQAGKKGWKQAKDIRYNYAIEPRFLLLSKKYGIDIFRIEIFLLAKDFSVKQLTGKDLPIKPHFVI